MSRIEEALKKASQMRDTAHRASTPKPLSEEVVNQKLKESTVTAEAIERVKGQHLLVSMNDNVSPAAEEFRKLKQNLVRLSKKNGFHNTVLVTSGTVAEGKSVTATNLAISLAHEFDHTVLLVDADIRRPSINHLLNLENTYGLADCLNDGTDVGKALVPTGIGKLTFLPAGTPTANPGELLSSKRMEMILREMKNRYSDRYIIIDSPPVLPFAETRILSRLVDSTILVVKEGRLSQYEVRDTMEALSGSNIIGAVFSQASSGAMRSGYSSAYGYSYYHSY